MEHVPQVLERRRSTWGACMFDDNDDSTNSGSYTPVIIDLAAVGGSEIVLSEYFSNDEPCLTLL